MRSRALIRRALVGAAIVGVGLAGCGDDGPERAAEPTVVGVETQRCRQPNRFRGVGIVVGDDDGAALVATAGHTVEGDLRDVRVNGQPAEVVALDLRSDVALLRASLDRPTVAELANAVPGTALLATPDGEVSVAIDRHVTFVVEHVSDRATYRRDTVVFTPAVERGTSGAPLLDGAGRLVALVYATEGGETFAVTFNEVASVLRDPRAHQPDASAPGSCAA